MSAKISFRVAFVCDFFYPRLGGVENHLWSLAQHLIQQGHKVTIITNSYGSRRGVRYFPGPLKVYYCPIVPMVDQDAFPSFSATLPLIRSILLREQIQIVHAHQATSTMANEAVVYAAALGLPSVYTDHSLFGFNDLASVILNRVQQITLSTVDAAICVSHTCADNLKLRAKVQRVHVIPNAIDPHKFTPDPTKRSKDRITVVVVSRLVYRKGVDVLVDLIPKICSALPDVDFLIGGDGSKRLALQEMVERERLQERVDFLGSVPHALVCDVLRRGHIFLNCSLTESFCIAILEAACTGLTVVSTNVGGVPEVLPNDMAFLSDPEDLVETLKEAIGRVKSSEAIDAWEAHHRVAKMYSWSRVATETVEVYKHVIQQDRLTFLERLQRYGSIGTLSGMVVCLLAVTIEFWLLFIEWWQPEDSIDVVPNLLKEESGDLAIQVPIQVTVSQTNANGNTAKQEKVGSTELRDPVSGIYFPPKVARVGAGRDILIDPLDPQCQDSNKRNDSITAIAVHLMEDQDEEDAKEEEKSNKLSQIIDETLKVSHDLEEIGQNMQSRSSGLSLSSKKPEKVNGQLFAPHPSQKVVRPKSSDASSKSGVPMVLRL